MRKKPKHNGLKLVLGCFFLIIGLAMVIANISLPGEKTSILEGILLVLLGGYLLTSLVWEQ